MKELLLMKDELISRTDIIQELYLLQKSTCLKEYLSIPLNLVFENCSNL